MAGWRIPKVAVLVVAVATAGSAAALRPAVVTKVDWRHPEIDRLLVNAYPPAAAKAGIGGVVELDCQVLDSGAARNCRVLSESPGGQGFAAAISRLSPRFRLRARTIDGKPEVT